MEYGWKYCSQAFRTAYTEDRKGRKEMVEDLRAPFVRSVDCIIRGIRNRGF